MRQVFIARDMLNEAQFERKLYVIRKLVEKAMRESAIQGREHFYIPSLSASTIVYKGLLLPHQMGAYYQDLTDASMVSALALVHSRFSTNTFPTWPLAHPYRHICHNGEINTLKGNVNWMKARQDGSIQICSARTWKRCFRSCTSSKATRPVSIMRSSFYCWGPVVAPRDDDADSRAVGGQCTDGSGSPRLLSISRRHDGALGRSGRGLFHGRQDDRGDTGPQRSPSLPLSGHHGRHGRAGVGSGRIACRGEADPHEGPVAARAHVPGRHRAGPHYR